MSIQFPVITDPETVWPNNFLSSEQTPIAETTRNIALVDGVSGTIKYQILTENIVVVTVTLTGTVDTPASFSYQDLTIDDWYTDNGVDITAIQPGKYPLMQQEPNDSLIGGYLYLGQNATTISYVDTAAFNDTATVHTLYATVAGIS